jgi:hypothetical protein
MLHSAIFCSIDVNVLQYNFMIERAGFAHLSALDGSEGG